MTRSIFYTKHSNVPMTKITLLCILLIDVFDYKELEI